MSAMLTFLRQFRIFDFAIFDLAIAFLGIYLLSPFLSKLFQAIDIKIPKKNWLFLTLPIAVAVHILFGISTPMTKEFLNPSDYYFLKFIILILFVLGLRGIERTNRFLMHS